MEEGGGRIKCEVVNGRVVQEGSLWNVRGSELRTGVVGECGENVERMGKIWERKKSVKKR